MHKAKFMQSAGRMRKLSEEQSIIIVGEATIFAEIRRTNNMRSLPQEKAVTIQHVLSWVMHNTVELIWKGIPMWSDQGVFYASSSRPEHSVLEENTDLSSFYGHSVTRTSVTEAAARAKDFYLNRNVNGKRNDIIMKQIDDRCRVLGSSYTVMRTNVDEECERELEREVEEEEEEEVEYRKMLPAEEIDWDYHTTLNSDSVASLPVPVQTIPQIMRCRMSCDNLSFIAWSKKLWCTEN